MDTIWLCNCGMHHIYKQIKSYVKVEAVLGFDRLEIRSLVVTDKWQIEHQEIIKRLPNGGHMTIEW